MSRAARPTRSRLLAVAACALLGACASSGTVVLLPEKDGGPTAVAIKQADKEVLLDKPYAAAKATPLGPRVYQSSPQEVEAQFGSALAAQPIRSTTFAPLYFVEGKDELTDESKKELDSILSEIAKRPVPDVLVVGYTDTVGNDAFNDALGQRRAEAVRAALIRLNIPPADIHAISRGKRDLAVQTPDGVTEPLNRRVVITVR